MLKRRKHFSVNLPIFIFVSALIAIAVTALIFTFVSFVMTSIDIPKNITQVISIAALAVGAYFGGYICAKKYRNNGLLRGAACGFLVFLVVMIAGSLFAGSMLSISSTTKLLIVIATGAVGGAIGVNSKRRRY
ncbi:MAG: TIGR04086 family membrane protein [Ruminococcus sp.]|nr:TIGR04086 family membrane protein [Ruminococcus sp.]